MRPPFRSRQEVIIHAPLEAVWSFSMNLRKIPEFHPSVFRVEESVLVSLADRGVDLALRGCNHF